MAERQVAIVGFPKCATMSLAVYSKQIYPGSKVTRPENIYEDLRGPHIQEKWQEYICMAITRNPIDRIKSAIQYWPEMLKIYNEKGIEGVLKGKRNYRGVGVDNPIEQSNYQKYITKFERNKGVKVEVYRFEDLIKDKAFPHINESGTKIKLTKHDIDTIKERLEKANITY